VPRLGREEQTECSRLDRPVLERRGRDPHPRELAAVAHGESRHGRARLEGEDLDATCGERHRRLARARTDLECAQPCAIDRRVGQHVVDERCRIAGARPVVQLGRLAEDEALLSCLGVHRSSVPGEGD
jgi:hypothetical protein